MIQVTVYYDTKRKRYTGFDTAGHAGYAEHGSDIVCSAVSALVITTINAIETLTSASAESAADEQSGAIQYHLAGSGSPEADLLLRAMILGLKGIETEYDGKYLKVSTKEV